jgi:type I restriction enzyme S subunit
VSERQWPVKPLEDVVDILDKFRVPVNSKERESRKGNIPYYGATGQTGWIDEYIFDEELVLLGEDGAPFLDHSKPSAYMIRGKAWVNNHAHVLRSKQGLNNRFLLHYLNQLNYTPYISGTTRAKLPQGPMKQIPIPIPPINYQLSLAEAIDTQLSRLDETVATLEAIQSKLKQARASILKAAVEGRLVESCHSDKLSMISNSDIDSEGDFRLHWRKTTLGEICKVSGGITKNSSKDKAGILVPYIRVANVYANHLDLSEIKEIRVAESFLERYLLEKGDLLIVEGNGSIEQLGRVAIWDGSIGNCIHQNHLIKARPHSLATAKYLLAFLNSPHGRSQIKEVSSSTSGLHTLSISKVERIELQLPPESVMHKIISEVDRRFSVLNQVEATVQASLSRCGLLRQAILKRAFEGRLVPAPPESSDPADHAITSP